MDVFVTRKGYVAQKYFCNLLSLLVFCVITGSVNYFVVCGDFMVISQCLSFFNMNFPHNKCSVFFILVGLQITYFLKNSHIEMCDYKS
jgi:hypothetical protein